MTTEANELLDSLSQLLNPVEAEQRDADYKAERERPMDRSPLQDFTATFRITGTEQQSKNNGQWTETHLVIELDDLEDVKLYSGSGKTNGDATRITLRIPDAEFKPRGDDESTFMLKSFMPFFPGVEPKAILAKLQGVRATVVETHEPYIYWDKKARMEVTKPRFFYKAVKVAGATNGATPKPTTPTEEAIEKAISLLVGGMTENAFNMAAMKDPLCKKDAAFISALASGTFVKDVIAQGRVVRDGETLVAV